MLIQLGHSHRCSLWGQNMLSLFSDESQVPLAYFVLCIIKMAQQQSPWCFNICILVFESRLVHQDEITTGKGVAVATIHSAKGLEWDIVFVMRQNQGFCPMNWWPSADEQRQYKFNLPDGYFDSFEILQQWDPLLIHGVWPAEVYFFHLLSVSPSDIEVGHLPFILICSSLPQDL